MDVTLGFSVVWSVCSGVGLGVIGLAGLMNFVEGLIGLEVASAGLVVEEFIDFDAI